MAVQVLNSFGLGYELASSSSVRESYKQRVLTGADTLHGFRWAVSDPSYDVGESLTATIRCKICIHIRRAIIFRWYNLSLSYGSHACRAISPSVRVILISGRQVGH